MFNYKMVLMNAGKMSRHTSSIVNKPNCGGPKKSGLAPRVGWFMSSNPTFKGVQQRVPNMCMISRTTQTQRTGYRATLGGI
jgi:hypothetical protein